MKQEKGNAGDLSFSPLKECLQFKINIYKVYTGAKYQHNLFIYFLLPFKMFLVKVSCIAMVRTTLRDIHKNSYVALALQKISMIVFFSLNINQSYFLF